MEEFYKKKIIRDFLTLFSESKWKNLCILCMEYGILMLKQKYQVSSLSMEDIEEFVNDLIEEESKKNQKNLKKLRQDIVSNTNFNYNNNNQNANNTSTSFKPSSDWRRGEVKTIFDGEDTNNFNKMNNNNNYVNYNQNINSNNYHYTKNNGNRNNFGVPNNYIDPTTFSNDEPAFIKKGKEKLIDDILFPKQNKIVNYRKDNVFNNNLPKKQQIKQYKTSYNESYGVKKNNNFYNTNSRYKTNHNFTNNNNNNNNANYGDYVNTTSFTENISFNNSKVLKRSSSFSNNNRFKSGLQKLKINKPLQGQSNNDSMNSSFSVRNNYSSKINNIPSKIKSQVEADKKIYGLLKKNQGAKYY
jgi:hypothetical protein